jgi:molecular chaperone GrpE
MNLSKVMAKMNGKTEVIDRDLEKQGLDPAHELPAPEEARASESGNAELQKLKAERDSLLDRLARSQAEFDNARKRAVREQQEFRDFALADAIRTLLPVVDSFELALRSSSEKSELRGGVELIYKQLQDALLKLGVQPVPAKGDQFDPRVHEAIEMVDTHDVKDQEVLEELQRGYKLRERLLRPAMVKVARNSSH